jgi:hypothetical protein
VGIFPKEYSRPLPATTAIAEWRVEEAVSAGTATSDCASGYPSDGNLKKYEKVLDKSIRTWYNDSNTKGREFQS